MRPIVGITAWRRALPTFLGEKTDLYTLGVEYVEAVAGAGGTPMILPHGPDVDRVLDSLDGLLLSGGDDVHPESYGEPLTEASVGVDLEADRWEIALVRGAAERKMPVLAICRGMQIMAVAFGGRLIPDLQNVEGHPDFHGMSADDILGLRHTVSLQEGCALAGVYGVTRREVNTIHHQAVAHAGNLVVVGTGDGGVIEAVEAGEDWNAWGLQWHPEKMADDDRERSLFRTFVEGADAYARGKLTSRDAVHAG
jgi:putative glutamine amidotransferase